MLRSTVSKFLERITHNILQTVRKMLLLADNILLMLFRLLIFAAHEKSSFARAKFPHFTIRFFPAKTIFHQITQEIQETLNSVREEGEKGIKEDCKGQISNGQCLWDRQKRRALLSINVETRTYIYIYIHTCNKDRSSSSILPTYVCMPTLRPRERDTVLESANAVGKQVNIAVLHESLKQSSGAPDIGCRQKSEIINIISSWETYFPELQPSIYLIQQSEYAFVPPGIVQFLETNKKNYLKHKKSDLKLFIIYNQI